MTKLIPPYGGTLLDLMAGEERRAPLLREAGHLPSLTLNPRQMRDLELLLNGALSPLRGYMSQANYERVVDGMHLADGTFWPMPIALDTAQPLAGGDRIALRDPDGNALAILNVSESWLADKANEARRIYGTEDAAHPGAKLLASQGAYYASGTVEGLSLPEHADFTGMRPTPAMMRAHLAHQGKCRAVAFQPHHPMHRAQFEFTRHSAEENQAALLIQAIPGEALDADHFTRIRCYQALLPRYPQGMATLSLLPIAPRPAGVREVLWRAIVARNYGCTHLVIGGDAGTGEIRRGSDALTPGQIQPLAEHFAAIGVEPLVFPRMVHVPGLGQYLPEEFLPPGLAAQTLPAAELQRRLRAGFEDIPDWASFPEVVEELRKHFPPRLKRGFTVFFTGLSGAGKTTLSQALRLKLMELTGRPVTLLDGDVVRTLISSGLSYSRADRELNIRRIGFIAGEITRHGGIAICAPIAPYRDGRLAVREMISPWGGFFEVHVSTPLEICEARDPKGLYARARAGMVQEFTGITAPYEAPHAPEINIDTGATAVPEAVAQIIQTLRAEGYLIG